MEYGPHCIYSYPDDIRVLYDVNDLVIHYVKRQANIQKEEKRHAKRYLKRFVPELFNILPQELSDEETEERGSVGLFCFYFFLISGCIHFGFFILE